MTRSSNLTCEAVDKLHDHQIAATRALDELRGTVWWATDILLRAKDIFDRYGPPPAPGDELRALLDAVQHFLLTCPVIDAELHLHPLPDRPETPGGADSGELSAPSGPNVDIHLPDDIAGPVADLAGDDV